MQLLRQKYMQKMSVMRFRPTFSDRAIFDPLFLVHFHHFPIMISFSVTWSRPAYDIKQEIFESRSF